MTRSLRENTAALILAAGDGIRLGGRPKALVEIAGKPLVEHVTLAVQEFSTQIIVGVRAADVEKARALLGDAATVVAGGATRQETVEILLAKSDREMVLIHDVARPFASAAVYRAVLQAAFEFGGATPVLPASPSDSVALADGIWLGDPLPRDRVVRTQTPYAFKREALVHAVQLAQEQGWEDTTVTSLLSRAGYKVRLVPGDTKNTKITYPEDLAKAAKHLKDPA